MTTESPVDCFISAGEISGDVLAAQLVKELNAFLPHLRFFGITGQEMKKAGVTELLPLEALRVMGLVDVLKNIYKIKLIESHVINQLIRQKPKIAILVDFPGFHFRLAEQLRLLGIKVIQYVAPKVWAWGERRIKYLERDFNLVMGIFPFELEYFSKTKVSYAFVGCPHVARLKKVHSTPEAIGLNPHQPIIACLPGSRPSEVTRILPQMLTLKEKFLKEKPKTQFCIPIAGSLSKEEILSKIPCHQRENLFLVKGKSLEILSVSQLALVASGTATLECALIGTPMIVLYKLDKLSYYIAKKKVKITWVSLVNIIMNKLVVPEFIQHFNEEEVVSMMHRLFCNESPERLSMKKDFEQLIGLLSNHEKAKSVKDCILQFI